MVSRTTRLLAIAGALLALTLPGLANTTAEPAETKKMCYCGCDNGHGAPMCLTMCELPKYQHRSWAASCRKPAKRASMPAQPQSQSHSAKSNRSQSAQR
jgi:hypothetical protein